MALTSPFAASQGGPNDIYQKSASGAGEEELLYKSPQIKWPNSWSHDKQYLLYEVASEKTKRDLWLLPMQGERKPRPFLQSEFNERQGQFSPDTRWVAYESDETGTDEIYVRPFPDSNQGKWIVSKGGGRIAKWRGDGRELIYLAPDGSVMAVDVTPAPVFQAGTAKALFKLPPLAADQAGLDVTPDGKRFVAGVPASDNTPVDFTVVLNWQALLKK